jgi:hypothetical protein
MHKNDQVKGRFQIDNEQVRLTSGDTGINAASLILSAARAQINASETWFNGKWIKIPEVPAYSIKQTTDVPAGGLFYSSKTKALMLSDGNVSRPAYWEYPDGNELNPSILLSEWTSKIGYQNLPTVRIRHPLNTSGVSSGNVSIDRDFSIVPYQYGMAIDYNGVVECWVGEFSIHKGLYYNIDVEGNGGTGWGGILWVGDDFDNGGIRATARNASNAFYSEISSETFGGDSHGPLRLRVAGIDDKFEFVSGKRGSNNSFLSLMKSQDTAIINAGTDDQLVLKTQGLQRLLISKEGNIGAGVNDPTSILDLKSTLGFNQLRLRNSFTPNGSGDSRGQKGDLAYDNNFIYIKTAEGWKRTKLETF